MYTVELENCGNIINGTITIEKSKLNIKYGINGTGKSTISKSLKYKDSDQIAELKSFYSVGEPNVSVTPDMGEVITFDEEFVNQIVFVDNEVIGNSFEVFLKTENYELKKDQVETRLKQIHTILSLDEQIRKLRQIIFDVNSKFKTTSTGALSSTGMLKSIINRQVAVIPTELSQYEGFITNEEISIPWIDWKGRGDQFDINNRCPYCSEKIDRVQQDVRKQVFKNTYSKADSQNLADMLKFLEELHIYLAEDKYTTLVECVKQNVDGERIKSLFTKLYSEFSIIINRYNMIEEFGRKKIAIADIGNLNKSLELMRFPIEDFEFFVSDLVKEVFLKTNDIVDSLISEIGEIKKEMGQLKGVLRATVEASQNDINEFLKMAGINYEIIIEAEDENESRTILRQLYSDSPTEVSDIKKHLSWGEKNAFALVLFMYFAGRKKPDLIILDDPISSFDSNKKYALMHRLFLNTERSNLVSLYGKTVLLLTHDFEPITDFVVVGKIDTRKVRANFIWNRDGMLREKVINSEDDIIMIQKMCAEIALDAHSNRVVRAVFLRKLCELNERKDSWEYAFQILSSLIHGENMRRKVANDVYVDMDEHEKWSGLQLIQQYIPDFKYEDELQNVFNEDNVKSLYASECCGYYKLLLFRELTELSQTMRLCPQDEGWFKYVDETYHIENDNLHYLDIRKFEVVPDFIIKNVDRFMV